LHGISQYKGDDEDQGKHEPHFLMADDEVAKKKKHYPEGNFVSESLSNVNQEGSNDQNSLERNCIYEKVYPVYFFLCYGKKLF
jgi:hypothetical protein